MKSRRIVAWLAVALIISVGAGEAQTRAERRAARKAEKAKKQSQQTAVVEDPYAEYVWPPPPNEPRIKLEQVFSGREDVQPRSKLKKRLLGRRDPSPYDKLEKPFGVAFDSRGRVLVTDWGNAAIIRFDFEAGLLDVLGTKGAVRLKQPLGLYVAPDDSILVADAGMPAVARFDPEGKLLGVYGKVGELENPTDVTLSPDGQRIFVADSKAQKIVVFDLQSGDRVAAFGEQGPGEGQFHFPTALAFNTEGDLFVVDQLNARVQVLTETGEFLDSFGGRGVGFGSFSRPKDIAVDEVGLIYVTDNAFNNLQLFDADFALLTFVGEGGSGPGRFWGASGVAVSGNRFAVVDQIGGRVQVFRFLFDKSAGGAP